jgi:cytidylate kinase
MHVAIAGLAGSGKSEAANLLVERFGHVRVKFADPLKNMFRSMLADIGHTAEDIERYVEGDLKGEVIDGLEGLGITARRFMIDLGTKFGRKALHPDFWVKLWAARVERFEKVVVDDMRFVNELIEANELDAITILIKRPGARPAAFRWKRLGPWLYDHFGIWWGVHVSERIDRLEKRVDVVIVNDGTLLELQTKLVLAINKVFRERACA